MLLEILRWVSTLYLSMKRRVPEAVGIELGLQRSVDVRKHSWWKEEHTSSIDGHC